MESGDIDNIKVLRHYVNRYDVDFHCCHHCFDRAISLLRFAPVNWCRRGKIFMDGGRSGVGREDSGAEELALADVLTGVRGGSYPSLDLGRAVMVCISA